MARKKNKRFFLSFESRHPKGQFTKISADMMSHPAWKTLTLEQQGLYLWLKRYKFKPTIIDGEPQEDDESLAFEFPRDEWSLFFKRTTRFQENMGALIERGLIEFIRSGRNNRIENVYKFSKKWYSWPDLPPDYKLPNWKNFALANAGKMAGAIYTMIVGLICTTWNLFSR